MELGQSGLSWGNDNGIESESKPLESLLVGNRADMFHLASSRPSLLDRLSGTRAPTAALPETSTDARSNGKSWHEEHAKTNELHYLANGRGSALEYSGSGPGSALFPAVKCSLDDTLAELCLGSKTYPEPDTSKSDGGSPKLMPSLSGSNPSIAAQEHVSNSIVPRVSLSALAREAASARVFPCTVRLCLFGGQARARKARLYRADIAEVAFLARAHFGHLLPRGMPLDVPSIARCELLVPICESISMPKSSCICFEKIRRGIDWVWPGGIGVGFQWVCSVSALSFARICCSLVPKAK